MDLKLWKAKTEQSIKTGINDQRQNIPHYLAYEPWSTIVEAYSMSGLSEERDKLIALSGIAQEAQTVLQDEYLAGLWKGNLLQGLLWHVQPDQEC